MLAEQPGRISAFAQWLNSVFECTEQTALGTLERMDNEKFDLILTNPPFVVSGSADFKKLIDKNATRKKYFARKYSGVEGLFVQYIVQALKKSGDAWVLLPEAFLLRTPDESLRNWILQNCAIDLVALLPERTFFNTPKRVVIIHMKRRDKELSAIQLEKTLSKEKTLLFTVGEIGETRDAKRFAIDENDLPALIDAYNMHKIGKQSDNPRAIVIKSEELKAKSFNVRHYWTTDSARKLGLLTSEDDPIAEKSIFDKKIQLLKEMTEQFLTDNASAATPKVPVNTKRLKLGDEELFSLRIGKRVLKKEVFQKKSGFILYSANIRKPFGYVPVQNAGGLKHGGALWSLDSDFDCRGVPPGEPYSITDHCGQVTLLVDTIDPHYLAREIRKAGLEMGFSRDFRPSLELMIDLEIDIPLDAAGNYDLKLMQEWTDFYEDFQRRKHSLNSIMD